MVHKYPNAVEAYIMDVLFIPTIFHVKSSRWALHATMIAVIKVAQVGASFLPVLKPVSGLIRDNGMQDLESVATMFQKGECPHIRRWFIQNSLPGMVQGAFDTGVTAVVQDKDNGGGWGAFDADSSLDYKDSGRLEETIF